MTVSDPLVVTLAGLLIKATMVMALAVVAHAVAARWMSAASRHLVTVLAVGMLLALPALSVSLPGWAMPVPAAVVTFVDGSYAEPALPATQRTAAPDIDGAMEMPAPRATPVLRSNADRPLGERTLPTHRVPWSVVAFVIYLAGVVAMTVHLLAQRSRVHRMGREARPVTDAEWLALLDEGRHTLGVDREVRLLRSLHGTMPMTFGTRRPAILLPATADTWDADRRRAVILHELAHVARHDCLAQWAACVMRAMYWCHPGAWWLVARLRLDREFACDDLVLAAGAPPREYARHLLDIAYAFGGGTAPALAVRMARRSQIEVRLQALLDASRERRRPSAPARLTTTAGAFAILLPLASLTSPAPAASDQHATHMAVDSTTDQEPSTSSSVIASEAATTAHVSAATRPVAVPAPLAAPVHSASPVVAVQTATPVRNAAAEATGCTWEVGRGKEDQFHLSMRQGRSQSGRSVPLATLEGLTTTQLTAGGAVHFVLRRDAGTFTFDGTARGGVAAGVCEFTPSPTFAPELARRGVSGLTPEDQQQLARHDVGLAFVDELKNQKYATPTVADLVKAGQHGVHLEYLRGMGALGYATGTLASLITLRDHGVTPDYVRELGALGYTKLPIEQLQKARDHGVTPDYVKGMRDAGHGVLTLEELITARDHGVTPEFGRALAAAGYGKVPLEQLVRVRDHGVSADYIRDMKALGIGGPLEDLVRARDHGVTPDYIRALGELGYKGLPLDGLIRMRDHGVSAAFVKDIQALGYTGLAQDDLVALRDHGLSAERIRQANARAGSRLPVSELLGAAGRAR